MNATAGDRDQTEEETVNLFTYEVSDEALEAAGTVGGGFHRGPIVLHRLRYRDPV